MQTSSKIIKTKKVGIYETTEIFSLCATMRIL